MKNNALKKAINIFGDQTSLSKAIGCSQQNISYWLKTGKVAADKVIPLERATGIPRYEFRPDIFPDDNDNNKRAA
ncbi:YdaS family helix-turn-helix protein [uncultured Psychrosphaera sp.]|uniref:transcriptional regulator n=1 Tax=uncultured Psychrosphaera sp. TaxID=1403522 RepID=UPI00261E9465|nr:YdaS family helix-turn-helix protein [uncultured Psychrosphaera sp.]